MPLLQTSLRAGASLLLSGVIVLGGVGALPAQAATVVTTGSVNFRTGPSTSHPILRVLTPGTTAETTGETSGRFVQVTVGSTVGWISKLYLSSTPPVSAGDAAVEEGLAPNAVAVHRAARAAFPQVTTYYGLRAGSSSDHSTGRALDLMIPSYTSAAGRALGQSVADWARANAGSLGIHYVIWDQHIWNIQRDAEGWRPMADRGGDSANHKNHVHISVY